jgi:hypothetical protein
MADEYRGLPSNISIAGAFNIASSTNATPIVVTTALSHSIETGDALIVGGHLVNTAANGVWIAGAVTATTVTLVGSVGNGVGGATGSLRSMDLGTVDIPEDAVDQIDAASVNVPFEAGFDRDSYMWASQFLELKNPGRNLPDADTTVDFMNTLLFVPDVTATTVYTLPNPVILAPFNVRRVGFRFVRSAATSGFDARIAYSGTIKSLLGGGGASWAEVATNVAGTGYSLIGYGLL